MSSLIKNSNCVQVDQVAGSFRFRLQSKNDCVRSTGMM